MTRTAPLPAPSRPAEGPSPAPRAPGADPAQASPPSTKAAAAEDPRQLLGLLDVDQDTGLSSSDADARRKRWGVNAVASHHARMLPVLGRQLKSPLLALLLVASIASYFTGERSGAVIITLILVLSVLLGFVNEYRAEKAADALHSQIHHQTVVLRDGARQTVDVSALVPGDIVDIELGNVVPADLRLLSVAALECNESVLTGESESSDKRVEAVAAGTALAELASCALMGTVVTSGSGRGVVVATGSRTEFGAIAAGLSGHALDTEFQLGLRRFSLLLVYVAGALTTSIFAINIILQRPVIDALLFSLAIAVGITPQLLPAVVSTSLAAGSRAMSAKKVLVKRLVCIEDLGDIDMLFTDKTGTLTKGRIDFSHAVAAPFIDGDPSGDSDRSALLRWGLLSTENAGPEGAAGGNQLDSALWASPGAAAQATQLSTWTRVGGIPFDHDRRMSSALVGSDTGARTLVTKGAPETVLERCLNVSDAARASLAVEFAAGNRVVAVATRDGSAIVTPTVADEHDLCLQGFLVFLDPPREGAAAALERLARLGITVKVVTGDNPLVAEKICTELGLPQGQPLTGGDLDALDDQHLVTAIATTTVFARVSPAQKARIVAAQRTSGGGVAFLGDGVNDALALHAADVGVSVDSATDVAKDAADVILLEKDLDVLADGVTEGRRIFANTIKYVLMGTSSNFGNMFSAAGASLLLSFLPMLPTQILLNNLLYDTSQLAIPTDHVDEEQLRRPAHWDLAFIRHFMLVFGPLSSLFDFATFGVMVWVFNAGAAEFRSGWFVESLATQTLVVFAIRTRRVPFFRSHASLPLTLSVLAVLAVGCVLPSSPIAHTLGFQPLPAGFFAALAGMVVAYLGLIEVAKSLFYRHPVPGDSAKRTSRHSRNTRRHLRRRIAYFVHARSDGG